MSEIENILKEFSLRFNREIDRFFNFPAGDERRVSEAMYYSLTRGGKRLRPFLVCETAKLFGITFEQALNTAMALEMLHTYSLIHDDLPAMDNDDLRRGFPTCHKQFDEATAIIAGDGLLTYAFEIMSYPQTAADPAVRCRLIEMLAAAAGAFDGMVSGQMLDLIASAYTSQNFDAESTIKHIEEMKTGRLLRYAVEAGAVLGNATIEQTARLIAYSRKIGIAFQIADDILDAYGDEKAVGKTLRKDAGQNKLTFVSLYGLEMARSISEELINSAVAELETFGEKASNLRALARYIIERNH
uniref:Farnesyl-diphosphate synthase n=1 Tax=uncultured Alphaproteobacteria bacterium TaxID=91750 RepID=A0A6G8F1Z4_9PROT|nr:farnesyl-diphosphate synthase [uncultured Alphaproteobacteria bacterium]